MLNRLCWACWIGGAGFIGLSHLDLVSPNAGWMGFYVACGAALVSRVPLPRRAAGTSATPLTEGMIDSRDRAYATAVKDFDRGRTIMYEDLAIALREDGYVAVACVLDVSVDQLDDATAHRHADEARAKFERLRRASSEIAASAAGKPLRVSIMSHCAENTAELCRVTDDGGLEWKIAR